LALLLATPLLALPFELGGLGGFIAVNDGRASIRAFWDPVIAGQPPRPVSGGPAHHLRRLARVVSSELFNLSTDLVIRRRPPAGG
jgi:hypothetical protein